MSDLNALIEAAKKATPGPWLNEGPAMSNGKALTRTQRKLLNEVCKNGGQLVVDGRRASVAKSLREMRIITCTMTIEQDALRNRFIERWCCCLDPRGLCAIERAEGPKP